MGDREAHRLNSVELGEIGQARFKEICADAKLICNQADRDRSGWDFIVEFPFQDIPSHSSTLNERWRPNLFPTSNSVPCPYGLHAPRIGDMVSDGK